jgi:hypothetical protein
MSKVSAYTLAIAVSLGTTSMLDNSQPSHKLNASAKARLQDDGAFRDGLYLGKLAAESGQLQHPAMARSSTGQTAPGSRPAMPWMQRFSRAHGAVKANSRNANPELR